jgi:hypothetical protein
VSTKRCVGPGLRVTGGNIRSVTRGKMTRSDNPEETGRGGSRSAFSCHRRPLIKHNKTFAPAYESWASIAVCVRVESGVRRRAHQVGEGGGRVGAGVVGVDVVRVALAPDRDMTLFRI